MLRCFETVKISNFDQQGKSRMDCDASEAYELLYMFSVRFPLCQFFYTDIVNIYFFRRLVILNEILLESFLRMG